MNLLIVGHNNSVFNENFITSLTSYCQENNVCIDFLNATRENAKYRQKIAPYCQNIFEYKALPRILARIPVLRSITRRHRKLRLIRKVNSNYIQEYDVVLIQAFWVNSMWMLEKLKVENKFVVGAFWGSDFYRRRLNNEQQLARVVRRCNRIIVSTDKMKKEIIDELSIQNTKIRKALFGISPLEQLYKLSSLSKSRAKSEVGLKENFVITCGYSAHDQHNHITVIKAIAKVRKSLPKNTIIVFPMTYGKEPKYIDSVRNEIAQSGIKFKIIENFLSDRDVALLRKATDIFIHVRDTDANSGSFQEHLFAGSVVITGKWLPYQKYIDESVFFKRINSLPELSKKLKEVIYNYSDFERRAAKNKDSSVFKKSLWSYCIEDWYNILMEYQKHEN